MESDPPGKHVVTNNGVILKQNLPILGIIRIHHFPLLYEKSQVRERERERDKVEML